MARYAALYFRRKTSRLQAFRNDRRAASVGAFTFEVKRSAASHEDVKAPRFAGRVIRLRPWGAATFSVFLDLEWL